MTGDYCDRTEACCGGSPDAIHGGTNPYGVFCDTAGVQKSPPANDPSTKDDYTCTNGQACNPPGNICGGSGATNASQNCCDGKKTVCKPDANSIYRCFGGCPGNVCPANCPTGYDANTPGCCIPPGTGADSVCQFRDQCCNFAPCVPGADGVLRCTLPTCTALHGGVRWRRRLRLLRRDHLHVQRERLQLRGAGLLQGQRPRLRRGQRVLLQQLQGRGLRAAVRLRQRLLHGRRRLLRRPLLRHRSRRHQRRPARR